MKVSPQQQAEVLRKLRPWLTDAGFNLNTIKQKEEGIAHHLSINFPPPNGPTAINLVRPVNKGLSVLISGTTVSPEHMQLLQAASQEQRLHVVQTLRRVAFQGGVVGFAPKAQGDVILGWQLDVEIYDDGLTQHSLFAGLRALVTKHLAMIDAFNEALGGKITPGSTNATGSSGYG